jgi:hypothetical protein
MKNVPVASGFLSRTHLRTGSNQWQPSLKRVTSPILARVIPSPQRRERVLLAANLGPPATTRTVEYPAYLAVYLDCRAFKLAPKGVHLRAGSHHSTFCHAQGVIRSDGRTATPGDGGAGSAD